MAKGRSPVAETPSRRYRPDLGHHPSGDRPINPGTRPQSTAARTRRKALTLIGIASLVTLLAGSGGSGAPTPLGAASRAAASVTTTAPVSTNSFVSMPGTLAPRASTTGATAVSTEPGAVYTVTISPQSLVAGTPTSMTVTLKNDAPATNDEGGILYITSATVAIGNLAQSSASIAAPGVKPGDSVAVNLTVTVPVGSGTQIAVTTNVTSFDTKSDVDGDDAFSPASKTFQLPVQEPIYTLAFAPGLPSLIQESQPFCPAVAVQLYQNGVPAAQPGIPVDITGLPVSSGPAPTLAGDTATTTDSTGLAVFGSCSAGIQIDNLGTFALRASSTSQLVSGTATSGPIMVLQSYVTCTGSCTTTVTSPTTGVSSTINASGKGTFKLGASFGQGVGIGCASQVNPGPWDPIFIGGTSGISGTVTMSFPKEIVNTQSNSGRPHMKVCALAGLAFQALGGAATTDGLVQDCVNGSFPYAVGPTYPLGLCVMSRVKGSLGHETITLLVSDLADPSFW